MNKTISWRLIFPCVIWSLVFMGIRFTQAQTENDSPFIWGGIAWSPDSAILAVATSQGIYLHDRNLEVIRHIGSSNFADALDWSPDGSMLAVSYYEVIQTDSGDDRRGYIRIWDVNSGELVHEWLAHSYPIRQLRWTPDGHRMVSVGGDKAVRVWNAADGALEYEFLINNDFFSAAYHMDVSPDSDDVVIWMDGVYQIYDLDDGNLRKEWDYAFPPQAIQWSALGFRKNWLATATEDGLLVWDITCEVPIALFRPTFLDPNQVCCKSIDAVAWNPDASLVAGLQGLQTSGSEGHLMIWNIHQSLLVAELEGCRANNDVAIAGVIDWSSDGQLIACGSNDGKVLVWRTDTFEIAAVYENYRSILVDSN